LLGADTLAYYRQIIDKKFKTFGPEVTPTTVASASDKDLDGGATRGETIGGQKAKGFTFSSVGFD
jgi:hypothetical protein